MKIDWKRKLTSRKLWAAVTTFVTSLLIVFKVDELTTQQVSVVIMAGGSMIAYIIGEGLVDAASAKNATGGTSDLENK